ncbi:hypothetical protein [Raineyella sp. W15-4]|uniref:hypothetical protein n=1 Tax=Raineyella sp. W15-4 TaxID=3081651 RepID=UPI0029529E57|nr:hypothetical protein [Raineyella sp. W15-4]WOQ18486.1 hypothetical protein R0145_07395 [Raineyella sp. W15-4]
MTAPQQPSTPLSGSTGLPPAAPFGADSAAAPGPGEVPADRRGGPADRPPTPPGAEQTPPWFRPPGAPRPPAPGPTPPAGPRRATTAPSRRRLPIVLVGAVVALVLIGGAAFFSWRYLEGQRYDARLAADRAAAREVAEAYLGALRDAKAAAALDTAAERPGNASLLTDETLRAARDKGGVTGIRVGEATIAQDRARRVIGDAGTVEVHYQVAGQAVDVALPVSRVGSHWKLSAVTSRVDLGAGSPPRTVFGTVPDTTIVDLFPGSYRIATTSTFVTLAEPDLIVTAPDPLGAAAQHWTGGEPGLSTQARSAITDAAHDSLSACLGQRSLTPAGCPIAITTGSAITVRPDTIRYTLLDDPWPGAEVTFDAASGGATGKVTLHYRLEAAATSGNVEGVVRQDYSYDAHFTADLQGSTPVITWK